MDDIQALVESLKAANLKWWDGQERSHDGHTFYKVGRNSTHDFYFRAQDDKVLQLSVYVYGGDDGEDVCDVGEASVGSYWGHD